MLAVCLLTACVAPHSQRSPTAANARHPQSDISDLLRYAEHIRALPEADLRRELDESLVAQRNELRAEETIRFALLHVVGNARFADPAAAARALEELTSAGSVSGDDYVTLAAVLRDFLMAGASDRKSAANAVPERSSGAIDGRQFSNDELERVQAQLDNERAIRIELERQLTELRSLEEALSDRAGFEDAPETD